MSIHLHSQIYPETQPHPEQHPMALNDPQPTSEHKVGCAARRPWLKERGANGRWEGVVAKGERGAPTRETGGWAHSLVTAHLGGADMWRERPLLRLTTRWHHPGCKLQTLSKALPGTSCWSPCARRSHVRLLSQVPKQEPRRLSRIDPTHVLPFVCITALVKE